MSAFGKMVALVASIAVLFLIPVVEDAEKQDAMAQVYVQTATDNFVDKLQVMGYINENMYNEFINTLDATGNLFTVELDHAHVVTEPELDADDQVTGYYEYTESYYEDDIKAVIFQKEGVYKMSEGDHISVVVKNRTNTFGDNVKRMLYGTKGNEYSILGSAGGRIRDTAYEKSESE